MVVFGKILSSWRRASSLSRFAIVFTAACIVVGRAQSGATPGAQFQYSALTGSGNTITSTRVPVVNSTGQIIYQDIVFQFDVDSDGNLTITNGFPTIVPSPNLQVSSFQPGKYVGPRGVESGSAFITITGPGILNGGATAWTSLATRDASTCTYPGSATWYPGPIDTNPLAARIKKAGITSTVWSYGISGRDGCGNSRWSVALIGLSQVGNTVTIASFTVNGVDSSSPVDQITYLLTP